VNEGLRKTIRFLEVQWKEGRTMMEGVGNEQVVVLKEIGGGGTGEG
jgi:hypothetical protein